MCRLPSKRILCVLLFVLALTAGLWANPFVGEAEGPAPVAVTGAARFAPFVEIQFQLRERIADLFGKTEDGASLLPWLLLAVLSFMYGALHAAGPGHRKAVIFSLFIGRKAKAREPLLVSLLSAGLHAGTAVVLVLIFSVARHAVDVYGGADRAGVYLEGYTLVALMLLAFILLCVALVKLLRGKDPHHQNQDEHSSKSLYAIVAMSSLIPCPGVSLVLMLSLYTGLPLAGFISVLAMSLGMSLVITIVAYLAWFGRTGLFNSLRKRQTLVLRLGAVFELFSYLFLLLFSLYGAWPFLVSLFA